LDTSDKEEVVLVNESTVVRFSELKTVVLLSTSVRLLGVFVIAEKLKINLK
jgi:hypothetical protein